MSNRVGRTKTGRSGEKSREGTEGGGGETGRKKCRWRISAALLGLRAPLLGALTSPFAQILGQAHRADRKQHLKTLLRSFPSRVAESSGSNIPEGTSGKKRRALLCLYSLSKRASFFRACRGVGWDGGSTPLDHRS